MSVTCLQRAWHSVPHTSIKNRILVLSFVCAIGWFIVDAFILPPGFGTTDIYYFKDAGINFAEGLGLVSRFTFGNPTFDYHVYSQYPPLYPLLFGFFVKLFGASAVANQIFNSLLSVFLGLSAFLVLKPLAESYTCRFAPYVLAAVFPIVVFTSFFSPEMDRPDALAVSFGLLALAVLNRGFSRRNDFFAGVLCAVASITSPFAGIWTSIAVALVVTARTYRKLGLRTMPMRLFIAAAGAVSIMLLVGGGMVVLLPNWFSAFFGVFTGTTTHNETGGGYFLALLKGDFRTWASGFPLGFSAFYVGLAKLIAVQGALAAAIVLARFRFGDRWQAWPLIGLLAISPLCLISSPYQVYYPPMTAALLLGAAASMTVGISPAPRRYYAAAIGIGFALLSVLSFPYKTREAILRFGTRPSLERALDFMNCNRATFERTDRLLAVSPTTYILWRQAGIRPLTTIYSGFDDPANRPKLGFIALSYSGSHDPMMPQKPFWLTDREYHLTYQPELPQVAPLFGRLLSQSSQTWESAIYERQREGN